MMELREYSWQKDSDQLMNIFNIKIYIFEEILTVDSKGIQLMKLENDNSLT